MLFYFKFHNPIREEKNNQTADVQCMPIVRDSVSVINLLNRQLHNKIKSGFSFWSSIY